MTFLEPQGPNGTVSIISSRKAGREQNPPRPENSCNFLTILRNLSVWGPMYAPTVFFMVVPKSTIFLKNKEKKINEKNEVQETG